MAKKPMPPALKKALEAKGKGKGKGKGKPAPACD